MERWRGFNPTFMSSTMLTSFVNDSLRLVHTYPTPHRTNFKLFCSHSLALRQSSSSSILSSVAFSLQQQQEMIFHWNVVRFTCCYCYCCCYCLLGSFGEAKAYPTMTTSCKFNSNHVLSRCWNSWKNTCVGVPSRDTKSPKTIP